MQTDRIVRLILTTTNDRPQITTNVTTWGELKSLIQDHIPPNTVAVVRQTEVKLDSNSIILPEEAFDLFFVIENTKSGQVVRKDRFSNLNSKQLMQALKANKLNTAPGNDAALKSRLRRFEASKVSKSTGSVKIINPSKKVATVKAVVPAKVQPKVVQAPPVKTKADLKRAIRDIMEAAQIEMDKLVNTYPEFKDEFAEARCEFSRKFKK